MNPPPEFAQLFSREKPQARQVLPLLFGRGFQPAGFQEVSRALELLPFSDPEKIYRFYRLLRRYSVRLLFYDLFAHRREGAALEQLLHYCSAESAGKILAEFSALGIVAERRGRFFLQVPEHLQMGDLFEWLVATILNVEFQAPAIFHVSLRGNRVGGDFDVLANWLGRLLYLEVKSAPPKGIHNPEIGEFLLRLGELKPDLAIFLDDTHLRVKDKIVLMFEEELIKRKGIGSLKDLPIQRVQEQIFQLNHYLYILNSKREIKSNLRIVFQDYLLYNLPLHSIM